MSPANSPVPIPDRFLERMKNFLGEEFPAFAESLNAAPKSGLRVNTLKLTPEQFKAISPFTLGERVPWCPSAFALTTSASSVQRPDPSPEIGRGEVGFGKHPYHLAGLYYLQDPSAMSPAELLMSQTLDYRSASARGEKILDLAAAPGGKTTHLAALMKAEGLLVANEIKDKRVGHLAQNVERWGAGNVVITNETPERLADHFGPTFDRVLVDAPCSGEGMFRKDMGARADWSEEMVAGCAVRQKNILNVAAKLVKPGGYLLYSTCTFAPEEDEAIVSNLLNNFEVVELPQFEGFMPGKPEWLTEAQGQEPSHKQLSRAVRLFPHRIGGEGHFACLLQRKITDARADFETNKRMWAADASEKRTTKRIHKWKDEKPDLRLWREFAAEMLSVDLAEERLRVVGERLYYVPALDVDFGPLRIVHRGVWLGTFKKERFEPAHPLALFLKPGQAKNVLNLSANSRELAAYLRGETLPTTSNGWTVVAVDGFPIGWGKGVQGTLKNHFPRGWMV